MKTLLRFLLLTGVLAASVSVVQAQEIRHQPPVLLEANRQADFRFDTPGLSSTQIVEAVFWYRYAGQSGFSQVRAQTDNGLVTASFTPEDTGTGELEYYLDLEMMDGRSITFPAQNPAENPVRVSVVDPGTAEERPGTTEFGAYQILSPEPESTVRSDDVVIAITFFYENSDYENIRFRIYLNDNDVSENALISPYLISYNPRRMPHTADHRVRITAETDGTERDVVSWNFSTGDAERRERRPTVAADPVRYQREQTLVPTGEIELSTFTQSYSGRSEGVGRTSFRVSGNEGEFTYRLNGLFTTQEDPRRQPVNRFAAELNYGNWLELQAGHVYPALNTFLISGRRMFGVNTGVRVFNENLQFQFLHGELVRSISPRYQELQRTEVPVLDESGNQVTDSQGNPYTDVAYSLRPEPGGSGTYRRNVTGGRMGIGSRRVFGWGLSALRVEDDLESIQVFRDFSDLDQQTFASLTPDQQQELQDDPRLLELREGAPLPQGNFALATDFMFRSPDGRINWRADIAASLLNNDISDGILTTERAEDLGYEVGSSIVNAFDRFSWLIIINEHMSGLPYKVEDGRAEPFVPGGIFAGDTQLNLNYFGHNLTVQYRWIGPDYVSLANSALRRDISGYTITDRFRLFDNSLFVTLGHENLRDNVVNNRLATTRSMTNRIGLSWLPADRSLPRISGGFSFRTRGNSLDRNNPFLPAELQRASVRNVDQVTDDDITTLASPRDLTTIQFNSSVAQNFGLFDQSHEVNVNYTGVFTRDHVFDFGDFNSHSVSLQLITNFTGLPLRTVAGVNYVNSESISGLSRLDIFGVNAGFDYSLLQNRLNLNADITISTNTSRNTPLITDTFDPGGEAEPRTQPFLLYYTADPNPDNITRNETITAAFSGGARYDINRSHAVLLRLNYTRLGDQIGGLNLPNDHLVQLRYITRF